MSKDTNTTWTAEPILDGTYTRYGEKVNKKMGYAVGLEKGDAFSTYLETETLFKFKQTQVKYPTAQYIGIWTRDSGEIVFDPIAIYGDIEVALRLAIKNEQEAIWDFKNEQEIYIKDLIRAKSNYAKDKYNYHSN